jgi:hypothetical protein
MDELVRAMRADLAGIEDSGAEKVPLGAALRRWVRLSSDASPFESTEFVNAVPKT